MLSARLALIAVLGGCRGQHRRSVEIVSFVSGLIQWIGRHQSMREQPRRHGHARSRASLAGLPSHRGGGSQVVQGRRCLARQRVTPCAQSRLRKRSHTRGGAHKLVAEPGLHAALRKQTFQMRCQRGKRVIPANCTQRIQRHDVAGPFPDGA